MRNKSKYSCPRSFKMWTGCVDTRKKSAVAKASGSSLSVIYQIMNGHTRPGALRAIALHKAMLKHTLEFAIPLHDLRPDIWAIDSKAP